MALYRPTIFGVGIVPAADLNANMTGIRDGVNSIEETEIADGAAISNDKLATPRAPTIILSQVVHLDALAGFVTEAIVMPCGGRVVSVRGQVTGDPQLQFNLVRRRPTPTGVVTTDNLVNIVGAAAAEYPVTIDLRSGDILAIVTSATVGASVLWYNVLARMRHV